MVATSRETASEAVVEVVDFRRLFVGAELVFPANIESCGHGGLSIALFDVSPMFVHCKQTQRLVCGMDHICCKSFPVRIFCNSAVVNDLKRCPSVDTE